MVGLQKRYKRKMYGPTLRSKVKTTAQNLSANNFKAICKIMT